LELKKYLMCKKKNLDFYTFLKNFKEQISSLNLKNTIQKDYILKVLFFSDRHLTVEDIVELLKKHYNLDIAITTVYKTVKLFEELNFITSLEIEGSPKYYELNHSISHNHLICSSCFKIVEFIDQVIELKQQEIAIKHKFTLNNHNLVIYGLCDKCR